MEHLIITQWVTSCVNELTGAAHYYIRGVTSCVNESIGASHYYIGGVTSCVNEYNFLIFKQGQFMSVYDVRLVKSFVHILSS